MGDQAIFDLKTSITQWQRNLASTGSVSQAELDELATHMIEQVRELQETGLIEEESFLIASHRLGDAQSLAEEFLNADPARRWVQRVLWGLIGVTVLLGAISLFTTTLWLAGGGWAQVAHNLNAFGLGLIAWPNLLVLLASCIVVLTTYRLLICRLFPDQRLTYLMAILSMIVGQCAFQLAMVGSAPLDSPSYSPKPLDQAGSASIFLLMIVTLLPASFCLVMWFKQRRQRNTAKD